MIWIASLILYPLVAVFLFAIARYIAIRIPLKDGVLKRILLFSWRV